MKERDKGLQKQGLQRQVSAIFEGVPMPKDDGIEQPSVAPDPERIKHLSPKKGPAETPGPSKPAAPSHLTSTRPKPDESAEPAPKAAPAKLPKADAGKKTSDRTGELLRGLRQIKDKLFASKPGISDSDKKRKVMTMLVPVLFIIMIFGLIRNFSSSSPKGTRPLGIAAASAAGASGGNRQLEWQIPDPYPTTLRDLMQESFGAAGPGKIGGLIVKGIVYTEDRASAVVGNQIVYEGGEVSGATVVKINRDSVEFEAGGKKWTQKVE